MNKISTELSNKIANMGIVCAFLVICIHATSAEDANWWNWLIARGIGKIAVPFFFVAAGFFLAGHVGEDGWWKAAVMKRMRTLIVPLLLWNFIMYAVTNAMAVGANLSHGRALLTNIHIISGGANFCDLSRFILSVNRIWECCGS